MLYYRIFTKDSLEHIFNANLEKVQPKSPASKSLRKKLDLGNEKFFELAASKSLARRAHLVWALANLRLSTAPGPPPLCKRERPTLAAGVSPSKKKRLFDAAQKFRIFFFKKMKKRNETFWRRWLFLDFLPPSFFGGPTPNLNKNASCIFLMVIQKIMTTSDTRGSAERNSSFSRS